LKLTDEIQRLADNPRVLLGVGAAVVILAGAMLYKWRNRPPSPEELERRRRLHVNHVGRIAEGRVTDLMQHDVPAEENRGALGFFRRTNGAPPTTSRQVICYTYSISGVTYETAQDITGLESRVEGCPLIAGQAASVKYDPSNPSNSILIADDWSGLH
jgi:hypothetical protein